MKVILKKTFRFTVITTLCLVATLFVVGGCNEPETLTKYYTLNFAGEGVDIKRQIVAHGERATVPENPERDGYVFYGWFTDSGTFANKWDFETAIVTQDTTLYAKWKENTLQETTWKWIEMVDTQTGVVTELDPDCNMCYTIEFNTDGTFRGALGVCRLIFGNYEIDYQVGVLHFTTFNIGGCELILLPFESSYVQILLEIQSFKIDGTAYPRMLHLYYNDGKNYLKYKEIGG